MPFVQFPNYLPDVVDYERGSSLNMAGVLPRPDGYGPIPSPQVYSQALPAQCQGGFVAYKNDGSVFIFAATATNLYILNNTTLAWTLISKSGGYVAPPPGYNWQFAQFQSFVMAVQPNTTPQFVDISSLVPGTTLFANMSGRTGFAGTIPNASYISIVGHFVVLSGLTSNPYAVQWSGLDAPFIWDGTNSSSTQILPDGGVVRGVAGGEGSGLIFQDFAIRTMTFTGEAIIVFQIQRISQDRGLYGPYTLTRAGEQIFYIAPQGLHRVIPGGLPEEIGKGKFNRTLMGDIDRGNLQLAIGAIDPRQSRIFLAYKSNGNPSTTNYDKLLCYDFLLDKATLSPLNGEYFLALSQPGLTLESLDAIAPGIITITAAGPGAVSGSGNLIRLTLSGLSAGTPPGNTNLAIANSIIIWGGTGPVPNGAFTFNIVSSTAPVTIDITGVWDTPPGPPPLFVAGGTAAGNIGGSIDAMVQSLDTFANALTPEMAQFDTSHQLNWFRGTPMQAIMDTGEQGSSEGQRMRVRGFRPITDAPVAFGSVVSRETVQATPTTTAESGINLIGICPQNVSTRYARGRLRIPAGTVWTYAVGLEPDFTVEGLK